MERDADVAARLKATEEALEALEPLPIRGPALCKHVDGGYVGFLPGGGVRVGWWVWDLAGHSIASSFRVDRGDSPSFVAQQAELARQRLVKFVGAILSVAEAQQAVTLLSSDLHVPHRVGFTPEGTSFPTVEVEIKRR